MNARRAAYGAKAGGKGIFERGLDPNENEDEEQPNTEENADENGQKW